MSITAKELARILGLSEAAVSMALNHKPGVSTATRGRVLKAAQKYGYDFARKKVSGKKGTICMVIYRRSGAVVSETPFFSALSGGVSLGCKRAGYDLVLRYLYEDEDFDDQLYLISASGFDGLIVLATEMEESLLSHFRQMDLPFVVLDAFMDSPEYNCVLINNLQGAYLATRHLITKCKAQPGYLRSSYPISNFNDRADGFYKAVRSAGMAAGKSIVHRLTPSQDGAYEDMKALLAAGEALARCYFADNDHIAIGAMTALKEAGYRIPEDVAVIGFDDLPVCEFFDPPLTTIHVPADYMGETAVHRLAEMIERAGSLPVKIEVGVTLRRRKSV
ncbi:MAG: LacI family DNA-binding transcriptional regulator [Lachnospiraceae bacterium]|nr:LacI family DNA-binding transcriptional regulator [Lachnospiraceae bacterium]